MCSSPYSGDPGTAESIAALTNLTFNKHIIDDMMYDTISCNIINMSNQNNVLHTSGAMRSRSRKGKVRSKILTRTLLSCACLYACQRTCQWNVLHTLKWLRPWLRRSPTNSIDLWGVSKCPSSLHQTPQACLDHDKVKEHAGPACTSTQNMIIWYNDIVYDMVSSCYHDITSIIRYHMIYIMLYRDIIHKTTVVPFLCSVYHDVIYAAKYIMT